jgi:hypothetical protein
MDLPKKNPTCMGTLDSRLLNSVGLFNSDRITTSRRRDSNFSNTREDAPEHKQASQQQPEQQQQSVHSKPS